MHEKDVLKTSSFFAKKNLLILIKTTTLTIWIKLISEMARRFLLAIDLTAYI